VHCNDTFGSSSSEQAGVGEHGEEERLKPLGTGGLCRT
jgi:hypothetical protein